MDLLDVDIADYDFLRDLDDHDNLDHNDDDDDDFSDHGIEKFYVHNVTCGNRLFGRQRPLHLILGGGLCADIILWRNKEISASVLAVATVIWLLFEWINYHFLAFFCHGLLLLLSSLFLWSNLASFTNIMSPPEFPHITLSEGSFVEAALSLRCEYHQTMKTLRDDVILGTDFNKFLMVVLPLGVLSVVGSWFNFLTVLYLVTVILLTMPMLYENYEDSVDAFVGKALVEMKRQYALFDEKEARWLFTNRIYSWRSVGLDAYASTRLLAS
ncbi:reticulon-like protein B6 [Morus notabilis]|uniref:reticulon-like protein B6 n=1 Tax=Morus notabilis TaxID=981085 RepID=UPI000CECEC45|nr:reticulon-like protein B6 [Morus notabilis]